MKTWPLMPVLQVAVVVPKPATGDRLELSSFHLASCCTRLAAFVQGARRRVEICTPSRRQTAPPVLPRVRPSTASRPAPPDVTASEVLTSAVEVCSPSALHAPLCISNRGCLPGCLAPIGLRSEEEEGRHGQQDRHRLTASRHCEDLRAHLRPPGGARRPGYGV